MTGVDYPKPMVNHAFVSKINMERMKQVYTQLGQYRQTGQVRAKKESARLKYRTCRSSIVADPGSGAILTLDLGSRIGFIRIPDFGSRIPDFGSRIPDYKPLFLIA
jgi:hypothetical protein